MIQDKDNLKFGYTFSLLHGYLVANKRDQMLFNVQQLHLAAHGHGSVSKGAFFPSATWPGLVTRATQDFQIFSRAWCVAELVQATQCCGAGVFV